MTISLAQAKPLCNASELALVSASTRNEIGKLSAAQLRQKVVRARKLRDKWRDQSEGQRRETQAKQGARQTSANARSQKKVELFGEVLQRFEDCLAKMDSMESSAGAAPKRPPRKARSVQHRATRAAVRDELEQARQELDAKSKATRPKRAKSSTGKATAGRGKQDKDVAKSVTGKKSSPQKDESKKGALKKAPPKKGKKPARSAGGADGPTASEADGSSKRAAGSKSPRESKTAREASPMEAARALQGLSVTRGKQRRATTEAKKNRLEVGGNIRIQKHISARNKRNQGRRDSR